MHVLYKIIYNKIKYKIVYIMLIQKLQFNIMAYDCISHEHINHRQLCRNSEY